MAPSYEEDVVETAREDGWFEGYDKGEADGEVKGRAEGINDTILEIVNKMKTEGMDEATILRLTGYSVNL